MRKETAQRDTATSLGDRDTNIKGRIGKKTSPNWDSDTGLGHDMNAGWENTEHSTNSGKQQMVVRNLQGRRICQHSDICTPSTVRRHQPPQLNYEERQWKDLRRHKRGRN